ncbi:hypothetical protein EIP91_000468 [Steccherinum ochraceum]|uniref:Potassium transporter n=1 Tax=Steccherinum ochraceum TaxID=92696 RepID=A0A4R0RTG6_9APHY|nr:hypothetical protein EIP91_000468 [Steccherinum ochraceum]
MKFPNRMAQPKTAHGFREAQQRLIADSKALQDRCVFVPVTQPKHLNPTQAYNINQSLRPKERMSRLPVIQRTDPRCPPPCRTGIFPPTIVLLSKFEDWHWRRSHFRHWARIIYSDIGTSPLYVLNGIWPASGPVPSEEDVIGGISAIIWSLTILPLIKYVFIVLRFGTHEGEGGTFALFQGLYPPEDKDFDADRTFTEDEYKSSPMSTSKTPSRLRWPLLIWALFGTSLTIADGIFTPAVSVTSAVAGIGVAKPSVNSDITPISIAILVVLFMFQSRGTGFISSLFAPITFVWFGLIAGTGIANIVAHPGILRAFDPSRAVLLFTRTGDYDLLAGILLALTGCEAMFANLGQFNALTIQISFTGIVYPSIILAYLGQGARLIRDGADVLPNLFYNTIPGPRNGALYWIVFVFAILATVIASQALITAAFSLTQQLINMRCFPPLRLHYTSDKIQGQVYIPIVNWLLCIVTIVVIAAFNSPANLTNAYGFAVATVMFTTTVMIALQIKFVKRLPGLVALVFFLTFGFFDGLFWGAAFKKVPHGAWVPLMIGCVLVMIMGFWTWARSLEDEFDGHNRRNLRHIIVRRDDDNGLEVAIRSPPTDTDEIKETKLEHLQDDDLVSISSHELKRSTYYVLEHDYRGADAKKPVGDGESEISDIGLKVLARIPTCAVFHKLTIGKGVPHSFISFFRQWPALPRVVVRLVSSPSPSESSQTATLAQIFLSVRMLSVAHVAPSERYLVNKIHTIDGFYGVTYHLGFRDEFDVNVTTIIDVICDIELKIDPRTSSAMIKEIRAVANSPTHIVPHYVVSSKDVHAPRLGRAVVVLSWIRRFLIEDLYRTLSTMFPETANWLGFGDKIIHVGINAPI